MDERFVLWIGRHGEAEDVDAGSDFQRVLTDEGRREVREQTHWLLQREPVPELILHSPLIRARQTAEVMAAEFPATVLVQEDARLSPGFSTAELLRRLNDCGVHHAIGIGHQPDIGRVIAELTTDDSRAAIVRKYGARPSIIPGTLAAIEFERPCRIGAGRLVWLVDPFRNWLPRPDWPER